MLLGSFLTWEESNRTDFSKPAPTLKEAIPLPPKLADRLNLKIDVDFQAVPFSEAFSFLSNEIATPIDIDGDALKAGGFTKNLKQTFQMDTVRVQDVIVRIFEESKGIDVNPEKCLVIIVNENEKRMLVTTKAAAIQKGQAPFEIGKDEAGRVKAE